MEKKAFKRLARSIKEAARISAGKARTWSETQVIDIGDREGRRFMSGYVTMSDKKVKSTREVAPDVMADYDKDGEIVGLEFLYGDVVSLNFIREGRRCKGRGRRRSASSTTTGR